MITEKNFLEELQEPVVTGQTKPEQWRRLQLERISKLIEENEELVIRSLYKDLGKPLTEAFFEIAALRQELKLTRQQLTRWMKDKRVSVPLSLQPGEALTRSEPLGCVLILGPWNYPFSLTIQPLISALAAGNTAVIKPSEHAEETSKLIEKLISKYFPRNIVKVFQGDGTVAEKLLKERFDYIFFTGGELIGKKVMTAAAENLTPVTLELGGKSPAIILEGAELSTTARRIVWGKTLNAGQTCIAPDHIFVHENIKEELIKQIKRVIFDFYNNNSLKSKDYGKIINLKQFDRLKSLLESASKNNQVITGGRIDDSKLRIEPTLIYVKDRKDPLMQSEIFGPLIPLLTFSQLETLLTQIRKEPKPLALYAFGGTKKDHEKILDTTSSGGVCFNDVVMQAGVPNLPFGGVGCSGMGRYHGEAGFKTFSNQRSILRRPFWLDIKLRYPPYNLNISSLKKILG